MIKIFKHGIFICDASTKEGMVFETGADGLYVILARTDENGIVTEITMDVGGEPFEVEE